QIFEDFKAKNSVEEELKVLGGAWLDIDRKNKIFKVWGTSCSYGQANFGTVKNIIETDYKDYQVIINEI
ncbi:MAG: hypothetical protein MHPSP_003492, partial [Paramarteilia canceri]